MKPVFQDSFGFGNGNCTWAAVASIFELSLSEAQGESGPGDSADVLAWTKARFPNLSFNNLDLGYDYEIVDGYPDCEFVGTGRWTYKIAKYWDPPDAAATDGYWLGVVPSQRLKRPVCDPYYPMVALHAVVMLGRKCVHDPNPKNVLIEHPQITQLSWWESSEVVSLNA